MITIKSFIFNSFQVNTYVLSDESGEAVIIDPACYSKGEFEALKQYFVKNNLHPIKVINTHGHIDHILGVDWVVNTYQIPYGVHQGDETIIQQAKAMGTFFGFEVEKPPVPTFFIGEGDKIEFGNSFLDVFHVPGHSKGSLVYYSSSDEFAVAGDVLFYGSIGRTDLPGGSYETLIKGIKEKLLTLPGNTTVYCGHGPATTIQHEYDTNPFLV